MNNYENIKKFYDVLMKQLMSYNIYDHNHNLIKFKVDAILEKFD